MKAESVTDVLVQLVTVQVTESAPLGAAVCPLAHASQVAYVLPACAWPATPASGSPCGPMSTTEKYGLSDLANANADPKQVPRTVQSGLLPGPHGAKCQKPEGPMLKAGSTEVKQKRRTWAS